jgi:AcrR family transcriptional regulator
MSQVTQRSRMKAERRRQLVDAASRLFAERGFLAVSMEDLAAEAGVSGPAVYRHFDSKEALLADLLIDVSEQLLRQGTLRATNAPPLEAMAMLNLAREDARTVSRLQRSYLDVWVGVLRQIDATLSESVARTKIQAVFGLLNSTPHSALHRDTEATRSILEAMALDALGLTRPR